MICWHFIIKCWPYCLIREFTALSIVVDYIPLSAKGNNALGELHDNICFLQNKHPETLFIIACGISHVSLTDRGFYHVTIVTQGPSLYNIPDWVLKDCSHQLRYWLVFSISLTSKQRYHHALKLAQLFLFQRPGSSFTHLHSQALIVSSSQMTQQ